MSLLLCETPLRHLLTQRLLKEWVPEQWRQLDEESDWTKFLRYWWGNTANADIRAEDVLKVWKGGVDVEDNFLKSMGVNTGQQMVVRACYEDILKLVKLRLEDNLRKGAGCIITGQPGNGMS